MYICNECGQTFDIPYEYEERHGFTHGPFEKWSVCPYCGEPGYEECEECDDCGEMTPRSCIHSVITDYKTMRVCDICYNNMEE